MMREKKIRDIINMSANQTKQATIGDFNRAAGKKLNTQTSQVDVLGFNLQCSTTQRLSVLNNITNLRTTRISQFGIFDNATIDNPPIQFSNGVGIRGTDTGGIAFIDNSTIITEISPTAGLIVAKIGSSTGTIDFSGSSVTGISSIVTKPGSYTLDGDATSTTDATPTVILHMPTTLDLGMTSSSWCVNVRTFLMKTGGFGDENAIHEFTVRAHFAMGDTMPTCAAPTNIHINGVLSMSATAVAVAPSIGHMDIMATGIAATSITWQASARILKCSS